MTQAGLLDGKTAVVFGAGGAIGGEVSRVFLAEGARLYASGIRRASVARAVRIDGPQAAGIDEVDATDERQVADYVAGVRSRAGRIDVVFNAISARGPGVPVGPSTDLPLEAFMEYMATMVRSQFLTAREAAKGMLADGRGVVIFMGATPAKGVAPMLAGPSAGHAAVEGLVRCLAVEWGARGVRVLAVRSGGMQETANIRHVSAQFARLQGVSLDEMFRLTNERALLKRTPTLRETADVIALLASDRAASITGAIVNASCGEVVD